LAAQPGGPSEGETYGAAVRGEFYKMNPFCPENWVPEPILPHSAPLNPHVLGSGTPMHFCV
jgi:hypothetical protein